MRGMIERYDSRIGVITLVSDGKSLTDLKFGEPEESTNNQDLPIFKETRRWLDHYFSGKTPNFTPPLNPQGTPFQKKVWQELLKIPYGETTTYGAIAKCINCRSAQAVGQAIHRNPNFERSLRQMNLSRRVAEDLLPSVLPTSVISSAH